MSNKMSNISSIGQKILQELEKQRLTKKWLYSEMGISRGTLDNWISGQTAPDHNELQIMYKLLNIHVENKTQRSIRDVIEDENYIAMHVRVYNQLEESLIQNRELLRMAHESIRDFARSLQPHFKNQH